MVSFSKTETNHFQSKVFFKKIEQTKPFLVQKKTCNGWPDYCFRSKI